MEKRIKLIIASILVIGFITALALTLRQNRILRGKIQAQHKLIKSKEQIIDSLYGEEFQLRTQIMRVELTLEHINQTHPEAFIEFVQYYDHETE